MPRLPRYVPPGSLVEVTNRTIEGRFLLKPSDRVNELILGVFGRAQALYGMKCCGLVVLSDHYHCDLLPEDAEHLAVFMQHVNGNITKEINKIRGREGPLWRGRYHHVNVTDEERAQVARLRYLLSQAVKENLVATTREWPGIHSVHPLVDGKTFRGRWIDWTGFFRAGLRKTGPPPREIDFTTFYDFLLTSIPCWGHLPVTDYRARVAELVADIEEVAARERAVVGKVPLGPATILAQDPDDTPVHMTRSPAPPVHAASKKAALDYLEGLSLHLLAFYAGSDDLRINGNVQAVFPEGSFPPGLPFVRAGPPPAWKSAA